VALRKCDWDKLLVTELEIKVVELEVTSKDANFEVEVAVGIGAEGVDVELAEDRIKGD